MANRTPIETLERLAQIAPKEWDIQLVDEEDGGGIFIGIIHGRAILEGDLANGQFIAWCKYQLWNFEFVDRVRVDQDGPYTFNVAVYSHNYHHKCYDTRAYASARTEWQALVETLIMMLEDKTKENTSDQEIW